MAILTYYPEMQEAKPAAKFEATLAYFGGVTVQTRETLKGRGIRFVKTYTAADLVPQAQHKVGVNEYRMTRAAFNAFVKSQDVAMETLL